MIATHVLGGFDDPAANPLEWDRLLRMSSTDVPFLTWHWQRAWWESFERERLLLIAAERAGQRVALAPLFRDAGMVYFVGSGGSDYLDFLGDVKDGDVICALLDTARQLVPGFLGFRFYHVPDRSPTGSYLQAASERLGLTCYDEGALPAPVLDMRPGGDGKLAAAEKTSLVRHERGLRRDGPLTVTHLSRGEEILPHLDTFFEQHIARWAETPYPSLFRDSGQRAFYLNLTRRAAATGWLRFTRLDWREQPIAFHFGTCRRGVYLWYKPTFAVALARRSPGEVLLRQLLLAAAAEGARVFDFGLGDEAFKRRFANRVEQVRTWGLYPPEATQKASS